MDLLFTKDPVLGRWHHTNSHAIVTFRGSAPHVVSFNAFGFRGPFPRSLEKPPGVLRIICLGGSTTEDGFVADGKTWPEHLQAGIDRALGSNRVEVINFGCAGYSTEASRHNLEVRGLALQPDVVIVYHANNDFWKVFLRLPKVEWQETYVDYEMRKTTLLSRLLCKSIILDRISRALYYRGHGERNRRFLRQYRDTPDSEKTSIDLTGFDTEMRGELDQLLVLSRQHNFRLVLGIQATLIKPELTDPELYCMWEVLRWRYQGRFIRWQVFVDGIEQIQEGVRRFARDSDLLCVDAEAAVPKTVAHFVDHCHVTETGTELVGQAFADALLHSGFLATPAPAGSAAGSPP